MGTASSMNFDIIAQQPRSQDRSLNQWTGHYRHQAGERKEPSGGEGEARLIKINIPEGATGMIDGKDPVTRQNVTTAILDATATHTGLPTDEESFQSYQKFIQYHWAEEKAELMKAYHLDQAPEITGWSDTFRTLIQETEEKQKARQERGQEKEALKKLERRDLESIVSAMEATKIVESMKNIQNHESKLIGAFKLQEAVKDKECQLPEYLRGHDHK
jgi:hypothetical protein